MDLSSEVGLRRLVFAIPLLGIVSALNRLQLFHYELYMYNEYPPNYLVAFVNADELLESNQTIHGH